MPVSSFTSSGVQRVKWDNRSRELGEGLAWVRVTVITVLVAFRVGGVVNNDTIKNLPSTLERLCLHGLSIIL